MKPVYVRNSLLKILKSMSEDISSFVNRPGADFTRNRKCSFPDLILLLLSMEAHTLSREIRRFFKKPSALITKSALIQQRKKLNDKVFPFLFSELNRRFPLEKEFKGYHLLGVDGSDTNIPFLKNDTTTHVPSNTPGVCYDQVHLNAVYDLMNDRFTDLIIQPRAQTNEREAFLSFLSRNSVPGKCIFIADRGYASINVLANLQHSGHFFLLRMKTADSKPTFLSRFTLPDDAEFDIPLEFTVTRSHKKVFREDKNHYVCIRADRRFDFIERGDRVSSFRMAFRLVKVKLPDGNSEFLATNLPCTEFSNAKIKELYRLRWGIETAYRYLKYNTALTAFHSIRRDFIIQEIYARVILYNFTMIIVNGVSVPKKKRKVRLKISISDAIPICRDFLISKRNNAEIKGLLCCYLTEVRPGRSFMRKKHPKRVNPLMYRA